MLALDPPPIHPLSHHSSIHHSPRLAIDHRSVVSAVHNFWKPSSVVRRGNRPEKKADGSIPLLAPRIAPLFWGVIGQKRPDPKSDRRPELEIDKGGFVSGFLRGVGDYSSVVLSFFQQRMPSLPWGELANYMLTSHSVRQSRGRLW
jgi:hypothetical protein